VLILLPPSEGKEEGEVSGSFELKTLSYAEELSERRRAVLEVSAPELLQSQSSPAMEIYSGVLYQALGYSSLTAAAKKRAESELLIFSAPFGVLRPSDRIPAYKLKMKSSNWSDLLPELLNPLERNLIIDCRSSTYQGVWRPNPSITVAVRVFQMRDGQRTVITHMSKKYRGELTRFLLLNKAAKSPQELLLLTQRIFTAELHRADQKQPWNLDLLISE
jgi:cytoplasmic iron level regulating protein YaaA (DUF328/UPF0246 family)